MMMPEPIMLTATMNVSCIRFIFFCCCMRSLLTSRLRSPGRFLHDIRVEFDASVDLFLIDTLYFVVEARKAVERFFECQKVFEHRLRSIIPALTRDDDADAWRIDQRE